MFLQEDTVQSISGHLDSICSTGIFHIYASVTGSERIILQFQSESHKNLEWDIGKIQDFVRKLGFLELDEKEHLTELFLFCYEVYNFYMLYSQLLFIQTADKLQNEERYLYKLGHPIYSMPGHIDQIECSHHKEMVIQKVKVFIVNVYVIIL